MAQPRITSSVPRASSPTVHTESRDSANQTLLMIAPTALGRKKGSSLRALSVLRMLAQSHAVDVITYPSEAQIEDSPNIIIRHPHPKTTPPQRTGEISLRTIVSDLLLLAAGMVSVTRRRYAAIHCEDFEGAVIGAILSFLVPRARLVYDAHNRIADNLELAGARSWLVALSRRVESAVLRRFDAVILNWERYRGLKTACSQEYLLLDPIPTTTATTSIPTAPYLIYSGNFMWYQGIVPFLKVFAEVSSDLHVLLIGKLDENTREAIHRFDLSQRIRAPGELAIEQANYAITNARAAVAPRIDGVQPSMKIVHYLMNGTPVLATDIPANRELLTHGHNAFLYEKPWQLRKSLKAIETLRPEFERLSESVWETSARIRASWDQNRFAEFYDCMLSDERT